MCKIRAAEQIVQTIGNAVIAEIKLTQSGQFRETF